MPISISDFPYDYWKGRKIVDVSLPGDEEINKKFRHGKYRSRIIPDNVEMGSERHRQTYLDIIKYVDERLNKAWTDE